MNSWFDWLDNNLVYFSKKIFPGLARVAIFVIFFWFGALKIFNLSPAGPLVETLVSATTLGVPFASFYILFGLYEMAIGAAFLIPGLERIAILLLLPHMIAAALPLIFLPAISWSGFLIPTLEGQYIIKNIAIVALAAGIGARLHVVKKAE